jgi:hypothetical protein
MAGSSRRTFLICGVATLAVLAVIFVAMWFWPGEKAVIAGGTPAERIASICRIADRRLAGGGEVIAAAAVGDADASVRQAAATVLSRYPTPGIRQALLTCLADADPAVRGAAARSMGAFDDDAAAARLEEMARKDADRQVRLMALEGLRLMRAAPATVALTRLMESHGDAQVQARAMQILMIREGIPASSRQFSPEEGAAWQSQVDTMKNWPTVTTAFEQTHQPLAHDPSRIIPSPNVH